MGFVPRRHVIVGSTFQRSPELFLLNAAPLLEEERHVCSRALLSDVEDPRSVHLSSTSATLAANNDPVQPSKIQLTEVFEQRFDGKEPQRRWGFLYLGDPRNAELLILDARAPPDVS